MKALIDLSILEVNSLCAFCIYILTARSLSLRWSGYSIKQTWNTSRFIGKGSNGNKKVIAVVFLSAYEKILVSAIKFQSLKVIYISPFQSTKFHTNSNSLLKSPFWSVLNAHVSKICVLRLQPSTIATLGLLKDF